MTQQLAFDVRDKKIREKDERKKSPREKRRGLAAFPFALEFLMLLLPTSSEC